MVSREAIKILIADDNQIDRMVLSRIVRNQGHDVLEAENGKQAVDLYHQAQPDLILMDVMMPEMDGREAVRCIKKAAGDRLVPVIFLTSLTDAQSLADCLTAGGDDFLSKPYNHIILQAKIRSFNRMREMHQTLHNQRDTIAENNEQLMHEQKVAKAVYDNVAHAGCLSSPNIRYLLSPLSIFNGDVLLAAHKPAGGIHVLLGDFTGHGLPAAIGAMPLAEIFYGMTAKGFGIQSILREINLKLKSILPVGFFCCAALVDMNTERKTLDVWMGGVPDCYIYKQKSSEIITLSSRHLPLGILSNEKISDEFQEISVDEGDRLFLWSDGIIEARNSTGEMFGEARLKSIFEQGKDSSSLFFDIQNHLNDFIGDSERDDDTTILELEVIHTPVRENLDATMQSGPVDGPIDWNMTYRIGPSTLKAFNPLPLMSHIIMEVPGLRSMGGQLHTVLAELFSNSFEHGLLKLTSAVKQEKDGFIKYYQERQARLEALTDGFIEFRMAHEGDGHAGRLIIEVEDSGDGFDHQALVQARKDANQNQYSGRGIPLINRICESMEYLGSGNIVRVVVQWPHVAKEETL